MMTVHPELKKLYTHTNTYHIFVLTNISASRRCLFIQNGNGLFQRKIAIVKLNRQESPLLRLFAIRKRDK